MAGAPTGIPWRLVISYALDWIMIAIIAIAGALLTLIPGVRRPFDLADPNISYPYEPHEKIPTWLLVVCSLLVPGVVTMLISLIFVPGFSLPKSTPKSLIWRRKLWEWNTAWLGLGLSLATAFFFTDGMKIMFGKPRPDLLSRCQPNVRAVQHYIVSPLAGIYPNGAVLVHSGICQQGDKGILNDGFMSFPSGHSSFSWAGLAYLTLFICAKFAITIPYILPGARTKSSFNTAVSEGHLGGTHNDGESSSVPINGAGKFGDGEGQPRADAPELPSTSAAPPVYLIIPAAVPICAAIYISSTRYSDRRHQGFDIIFGSLLGLLTAWLSFRWFHAPIRRGAGWSWGPRGQKKEFWLGVGGEGWGMWHHEEWERKRQHEDVEAARPGSGGDDRARLAG